MKHLVILMLFLSVEVAAQDVIVKKDGSTILSKVLEVNTDNIKYKKFSNQNGPTYTIGKSEIMSINYENGDRDSFETTVHEAGKTEIKPSATSSEALAMSNAAQIKKYNDRMFVVNNNNTGKKGKLAYCKLNLTQNSVVENEDVELVFESSNNKLNTVYYQDYKDELMVRVRNKSQNTIFLDLANTFFGRGDEAQAYYVPTATSVSVGHSSGAAVNMGAVAGSLGIGGAVGTLANGVTVGGGKTSTSTTIEYSQRIVSVPPMSSLALPGAMFFCPSMPSLPFLHTEPYATYTRVSCGIQGLMAGDVVHFTEQESPIRFFVFLSYSNDENLSSVKTTKVNFYLSELLGIGRSADNGGNLIKPYDNLFGATGPLNFIIRNDPKEVMNPIDINSLNADRARK